MEQIRPTKEKKKTKKKQQPKRMPALCPRDANNSMVRHKQVHWRVTRQRKHLKGRLKATFLSQLPLYTGLKSIGDSTVLRDSPSFRYFT